MRPLIGSTGVACADDPSPASARVAARKILFIEMLHHAEMAKAAMFA